MGRRILVLCGERHIARLVEVNLQRAGYEVFVASPADDLAAAVAAARPQLIVLDPGAPPGTRNVLACLPETAGVPIVTAGEPLPRL
jgi:DNA-binding response OmpR family regulator